MHCPGIFREWANSQGFPYCIKQLYSRLKLLFPAHRERVVIARDLEEEEESSLA
jgi:hypothetical protein